MLCKPPPASPNAKAPDETLTTWPSDPIDKPPFHIPPEPCENIFQ